MQLLIFTKYNIFLTNIFDCKVSLAHNNYLINDLFQDILWPSLCVTRMNFWRKNFRHFKNFRVPDAMPSWVNCSCTNSCGSAQNSESGSRTRWRPRHHLVIKTDKTSLTKSFLNFLWNFQHLRLLSVSYLTYCYAKI